MSRWNRRDWLLLLALTALAAALRFYGLGSVPPGFQFDEAFNATDAAQVLQGQRPLFLPANGGREVVYTYLQAALAAVFGLRLYTLRLASALAGIAAVPLCYVLLRTLLARRSRSIAAFTSLALAISFWHLHFSHYGIRVVLMPVLFSGVFGLYWWGYRSRRLWPFVASGALAGLAVWTHPTGRLAPFVLAGYTAWVILAHRPRSRRAVMCDLAALLVAGLAALLVFVPLGAEYYRHPDFFLGHASGVSVFAERVSGGSPALALLRNAVAVLGMFSVRGDMTWIHNLAGRPVFDPLLSIPFYLGLVIWVWRLRAARDPDRDALALLMLWTLVMLLPSVFSDDAPNFSRTLPSLPAVFLAVGLGLDFILAWTAGRADRHRPAVAGPVKAALAITPVVLIVGVSFALAFRDYFLVFPGRAEAYYAYDVDKLDGWQHLQTLTEGHEVYLSQLWAEHGTLNFLRRSSPIKSLDSSDTVVMPPPGLGAVYAFPGEQYDRAAGIAALWPGLSVERVADRYGNLLMATVTSAGPEQTDWPAALSPAQPTEIGFNGGPTLLGMQAQGDEVTLFWRAEAAMPQNLTSMLQLVDARGEKVGQADKQPGNGSYPTSAWTPGERVIERYHPALDACRDDEPLRVVVGWYELKDEGTRLSRADGAGDMALAGVIRLPLSSRPVTQTQPPYPSGAATGPLSLLGYGLEGADLQAGSPLALDLYWQGGPDGASKALRISLVPEDGSDAPGGTRVLWQGSVAPDGTLWREGEALCRHLSLRLPADAPAGRYRLVADVDGHSLPLTGLTLGASTRRFTAPAMAHPINATLDNQIRLLGADLSSPVRAGQALTVTLTWQAVAAPQAGYQVFVHMVDQNGQIAAQADAMPAGGYSTERWLPGEIVVDSHVLVVPAGGEGATYRLLAGLYDPLSGVRLPALDAADQAVPDNAIPLGRVQVQK